VSNPDAAVATHRRVLIVDDSPAIHADIRKLFAVPGADASEVDALEAQLFGSSGTRAQSFHFDSAYQGQEALQLVEAARAAGQPYAIAIVDMRMPPGWTGLETISHLWKADPELQIAICTAYSDYGWSEIIERLGQSSSLLILKKPFDSVEIVQMIHALAEKWRLGRELKSQLAALEDKVGERTHELEQANLRLRAEIDERQRIAAELRKAERLAALGTVTAGVAHEINNPLAYMLANLQFVGQSLEDVLHGTATPAHIHEASAALQEASDGAERIRRIVADMRTLARTEEDPGMRTDVIRALESALSASSELLGPRAKVVRELAPVSEVRGDERRLTQVFMNLIQNAAQAVDQSDPESNVLRVRTWSEDNLCVGVEITDSGCGISAELLPRIFDPFFTTRSVGSGTGLGLAICHSVVTGLGGAIQVASTPGKGSTFRLMLRAAEPRESKMHAMLREVRDAAGRT
jgi:two-component system, NtrC family, sensor kinase